MGVAASLAQTAVHAVERTHGMEGLFDPANNMQEKRTWPELVRSRSRGGAVSMAWHSMLFTLGGVPAPCCQSRCQSRSRGHSIPPSPTLDRAQMGLDKEQAKEALERAFPALKVFTVGPDRMVTMDFRTDRVRIFFDEHGKVNRVPQIG